MELYLSAKLYKVFDKTQRILRTAAQIEEKLQNLRIAYDKQHKETQACADKLHENRASALPNLQQSVQDSCYQANLLADRAAQSGHPNQY